MDSNISITVIGQGYVGLPLALEFAKHFPVLGFDIDSNRVDELNNAVDHTFEADLNLLSSVLGLAKSSDFSKGYIATSKIEDIQNSNVYIITVPTPIDKFNAPDLFPLMKASEMVGSVLKKNDVVIYESTVYPGCTEEECVPILEKKSGLIFNKDFYVGYSPERIVPGDKINTLKTIMKVTSGSTPEVADLVDGLYQKIIIAGTHKAPSIKVAEASKAIENAQRDINISFVNELALIFDRVGIDTQDVLDAAGTKFNFLKYKPGLVGGHCISVDPYYLAHKATQLGYHPQVILSGRRVNNMMAQFIAGKVVKLMIKKGLSIKNANALILGVTFKENCPDVRNTKVVEIYSELNQFGLEVDIVDNWANKEEVLEEYGISIFNEVPKNKKYDVIVLAVAHNEFIELNFEHIKNNNAVVFDVKAILDREIVDSRL